MNTITLLWDAGVDSKGKYVRAIVYQGNLKVGSFRNENVLKLYSRTITRKQTINIARKEIRLQVNKLYKTNSIIEKHTTMFYRLFDKK